MSGWDDVLGIRWRGREGWPSFIGPGPYEIVWDETVLSWVRRMSPTSAQQWCFRTRGWEGKTVRGICHRHCLGALYSFIYISVEQDVCLRFCTLNSALEICIEYTSRSSYVRLARVWVSWYWLVDIVSGTYPIIWVLLWSFDGEIGRWTLAMSEADVCWVKYFYTSMYDLISSFVQILDFWKLLYL